MSIDENPALMNTEPLDAKIRNLERFAEQVIAKA